MNRYRFFWGILVLMLGVMLLLNTLGILSISAWNIFWPLVLVAVGGWLLLGGAFSKRPSLENQNLYIPLSQASSINLRLKHAAGRLHIASGSLSSQDALSGSFLGGVDYESLQEDSALNIRLKAPAGLFWNTVPFGGFQGFTWDIFLNRQVPLKIKIKSGANESNVDLSDLKVSELELDTGASSTRLILPAAAGFTRVKISSGAASVQIKVPDGVAARFEIKQGLAGINVDTSRFFIHGGVYESYGYASAPNRVDAVIETGVGSVEIH